MESRKKAIGSRARDSIVRFFNLFGGGPRVSTPPAPNTGGDVLDVLEPRFHTRLRSMYRGEPQLGIDANSHPIDMTRISRTQGMWLYELCVSVKPTATLEIGMAYGFSTLYFLAAAARNLGGHHTAIDPFQRSRWQGIGLAHAQALTSEKGSSFGFHFIEERSDRAATDLARSDSTFEVIFIDGNHRFDDVLVDFYLYAPLCAEGGYMIFDDMWLFSIQTVVAFVRTNRADFVEVATDQANICVFKKIGPDPREWRHFRQFAVSPSSD